MTRSTKAITFFIFLLLVLPALIVSECTCEHGGENTSDKDKAVRYKIGAIVSILAASAIGILIPVLGKFVPALSPEKDIFFLIKAFAAGVILATGFIHMLPEAFERLTSPCLSNHVWENFPFAGFVAMGSAMGTLMVDAFTTAYFKKLYAEKGKMKVSGDEEEHTGHEGHVHLHTHTTHDHSQGSSQLRHKVISQVLELGIIAHSVIIGISLGASESPKTIKPLVGALTSHQLFEGMGLGSCITQAEFNNKTTAIMGLFFALTTPVGIAIGIGISKVYDENSESALIVEGIFDAASAGILIYMALVDFLAADFMGDKILKSIRLLLAATLSLLFGAALMSLLAKWA